MNILAIVCPLVAVLLCGKPLCEIREFPLTGQIRKMYDERGR